MPQRSVISIGNFDGVHLGHRAILGRARAIAQHHGAAVRVLTFDPHPAHILRPGTEPPRLISVDERVHRLKEAGADEVVLLEPTRDLLSQRAEAFVGSLIERYRPVAFVEGEDFRFGKGRAGDMALLAAMGKELGFEAVIEPGVEVLLCDHSAARVSSTLVRWLVGHGRVLDAARCLTRPFELTGPVVGGERRGRTIGVPTANLDPAAYAGCILPASGVYAGTARLADGSTHAAALSVGAKPTFGKHRLVVEAHLLDFAGDLYEQPITLRFARWVREQLRYPSVESLVAQLHRDIALTRHWHERGLLEPGDGQHVRSRHAG